MTKKQQGQVVVISDPEGKTQAHVVPNKTQLNLFLFSFAVRHWAKCMGDDPIPKTMREVIGMFYGKTGRCTYNSIPTDILTEESISQLMATANKTIDRLSSPSPKQKKTTV